MYKLSAHAINQYCIRTGANLMTQRAEAETYLVESLNNAVTITQRDAFDKGFTVTPHKKNVLKYWHNDCIDEDMLAIIRENTVITVLLPYGSIVGLAGHRTKVRQDMGRINRAAKGR